MVHTGFVINTKKRYNRSLIDVQNMHIRRQECSQIHLQQDFIKKSSRSQFYFVETDKSSTGFHYLNKKEITTIRTDRVIISENLEQLF